MRSIAITSLGLALFVLAPVSSSDPPAGFRALFNDANLDGWHGNNPHDTNKAPKEKRGEVVAAQQESFKSHWSVEGGVLVNDGHGPYCTTNDDFGVTSFSVAMSMVRTFGFPTQS